MHIPFRWTAVLCLAAATASAQAPGAGGDIFDGKGFSQSRAYFGLAPVEHIDPMTGNVMLVFTDLVLPGDAGFDLKIQRTYNSKIYRDYMASGQQLGEDSWAGLGWSLHMGRIKGQPQQANPTIEMSDGSAHATHQVLDTSVCPNLGTCWITRELWVYGFPTLRLPNGVEYHFAFHPAAQASLVDRITDPYGNRIDICYMSQASPPPQGCPTPVAGQPPEGIASITQHVGGGTRVVTFHTSPRVNTTPAGTFPLRDLDSMSVSLDGIPRTWLYKQDAVPEEGYTLLKEVVPPEGNADTTWKYEYTSAQTSSTNYRLLLKKATSPTLGYFQYVFQEKTLSLGQFPLTRAVVLYWRGFYDFFNNGSAYYFYPLDSCPNNICPGGISVPLDGRVVQGPCARTTYRYYGIGSINAGTPAWKVGSVRSTQVADPVTGGVLSTEEIDYCAPGDPGCPLQRLSLETETVGYQQTVGIYLRLPKSRTVTRQGHAYSTTYTYRPDHFNDFGNPESVVESGDGGGRTTTFAYDYNFTPYLGGRVSSESVTVAGPNGGTFTKSYDYDDATGFMTSQNVFGVATTFGKDAHGNVATVTDANSHTTTMTYDWGVVDSVRRPEDSAPSLTRDINAAGTVASETRLMQAGSSVTTFQYDRLFRLKETHPPLGNPTITTYDNVLVVPGDPAPKRIFTVTTRGNTSLQQILDGAGRVEHTINALGEQSDVDYDSCGRTIFESEPFVGSIALAKGMDTAYDALGRVVRKTHTADQAQVSYVYHDGIDVDVKDEVNKVTKQDWSAFGNPDEARLAGVTDADNKLTQYTYNTPGSLLKADFAEGPDRTWVYNPKNRLESETHPERGTVSYVYDLAGNVTERRDARFPSTQPTRFCYDNNSRLVKVALPGTTNSTTCLAFDGRSPTTRPTTGSRSATVRTAPTSPTTSTAGCTRARTSSTA